MLPQKYAAEIFKDAQNKELLRQLILQLNRDFHLTGINNSYKDDISVEELVLQLNTSISNLIKTDFQTYVNLLYRIDVSESKMRQIDEINTEKIVPKVTFLILSREWQKVWFKNKN